MTVNARPPQASFPGRSPTARTRTVLALAALIPLLAGLLGAGLELVATRSLGPASADRPVRAVLAVTRLSLLRAPQ